MDNAPTDSDSGVSGIVGSNSLAYTSRQHKNGSACRTGLGISCQESIGNRGGKLTAFHVPSNLSYGLANINLLPAESLL